MPSNQIIFGSGGGFTGIVKEYCLLQDGRIVEKSKDGSVYNIITSIDRDIAKQAFSNCQFLGLNNLKFDDPGNIYQFLTIHTDSQTENRIVWGNINNQPPSEVTNLHKMLMSFIPKIKDDK